MGKIYTRKILKIIRQDLRKSSTLCEKILWNHVRNKKLGYKFYRQYSIGPYVADFYCPNVKLIVELDGSHHDKSEIQEYDSDRTKFFEELGLKVIRFWNDEVMSDVQKILLKIRAHLPLLSEEGSGEKWVRGEVLLHLK